MKTAVEVLREAKALIPDEAHWWRGPRGRGHSAGAQCPILAVDEAGNRSTAQYKMSIAFFVKALGFDADSDIPAWSDAAERTLEEVHSTFDRAIALAERK